MAKYFKAEQFHNRYIQLYEHIVVCGLDKSRLPLHDKMLQIMKNTGLQSELIFLEG